MNMKSILLGSATALIAAAGAQAADLPSTKSAPAQYVRICDVYGAGFFYVPGTDTCLKVGGRVRFEMAGQTLKDAIRSKSAGGTGQLVSKNGMDQIGWNSRGYLSLDARTQSAWGTVQTVVLMRINSASGVLANNYGAGTVTASNSFSPTLENAYIRFAGFTFGRAYSNFTTIPPYMWNTDRVGGFGAGVKQLAYTATFGGGFSATVALEDKNDSSPQVGASTILGANGSVALNPAATTTGPNRLPNLIGNLRVDQAWGWAQLSGAVGQSTSNGTAVGNSVPVLLKKTGWAVAGSVRINLPMLAAGDHIHFSAGYSDGLINYVGPEANGGAGKTGPWIGGLLRNDRNVTVFCANAGCTALGQENTKAWHVLGMLTHYWTPSVRQNLSASYQVITPGAQTKAATFANGGLSQAKVLSLGTNVIWSPVRGFDIGLELSYARLNQGFNAGAGVTAPSSTVSGVTVKAKQDVFGARMRVERTF